MLLLDGNSFNNQRHELFVVLDLKQIYKDQVTVTT